MIILKAIGLLFAAFIIYVLFLFVCSLFVSSKKEYEDHSRFYRMLLNGATALAMKIMRIRIHTSGTEKVPQDTKKASSLAQGRTLFLYY